MTATDSRPFSALAGRMSLSGSEVEAEPIRETTDPELRTRLARADAAAQRELAELLAPRVRRVARAFMGQGRDADDAAHDALIELLRMQSEAVGARSVERWADRRAALSVLRFARAVRRRGPDSSAGRSVRRDDGASARTFDQYLDALSEESREVLLLRHALGLRVSALPEALCCSQRVAQDRLRAARRELRSLVRRRGRNQELGPRARRWCVLRDREALEEPLRPEEREELATLEANEPEIWAYLAQVRALELYFASHARTLSDDDRALVEAALPAVQMTSEAAVARALQGGDDDRTVDADEGRLSRVFSVGASIVLAAGCLVALALRTPSEPPTASVPEALVEGSVASAPAPIAPTVQALTTAALVAGRAHDGERLLMQGRALHERDLVESFDRPSCVRVDKANDVCLAPYASVRVESLLAGAPELVLLRGRLTARARSLLKLRAAGFEATTASGAMSLELAEGGELVTMRALEGSVEFGNSGAALERVNAGSAVTYRAASRTSLVQTLPSSAAARDLELFAQAGLPVPPSARAASARPPAAVARPASPPVRESPSTSSAPAVSAQSAGPETAPPTAAPSAEPVATRTESSAERLLRDLEDAERLKAEAARAAVEPAPESEPEANAERN